MPSAHHNRTPLAGNGASKFFRWLNETDEDQKNEDGTPKKKRSRESRGSSWCMLCKIAALRVQFNVYLVC